MEGTAPQSRPYLLEAIARDACAVSPRQILAALEEPRDPATALRLCQEIRALAPGRDAEGDEECIRELPAAAVEANRLVSTRPGTDPHPGRPRAGASSRSPRACRPPGV